MTALAAGAALAIERGGGPAVAALAPIGGYAAPPPPAWAFIRLHPGPSAPGPSMPVGPLFRVAAMLIGGYDPTPAGAVGATFPGLQPPGSGREAAAGPAGAVPE